MNEASDSWYISAGRPGASFGDPGSARPEILVDGEVLPHDLGDTDARARFVEQPGKTYPFRLLLMAIVIVLMSCGSEDGEAAVADAICVLDEGCDPTDGLDTAIDVGVKAGELAEDSREALFDYAFYLRSQQANAQEPFNFDAWLANGRPRAADAPRFNIGDVPSCTPDVVRLYRLRIPVCR